MRDIDALCGPLRFRPEGPISGSPGRSPGTGAPPKNIVLRPEGPISRRVLCSRLRAGVRGAYARGSAETGPSGLV